MYTFSAISIHIRVYMYNLYTYPSGHVYFLAIFIHIGVDMYNLYTYLSNIWYLARPYDYPNSARRI